MFLMKSVTKGNMLSSLELCLLLVASSVSMLKASTCHATCSCTDPKYTGNLYGGRYNFVRANCGSNQNGKPVQRTPQGYGILNAEILPGTTTPCTALSSRVVPGMKYTVTVELFNEKGKSTQSLSNWGHLGIAFNVQDEKNFDIVYFRPHYRIGCYQVAKYLHGKFAVNAHARPHSAACPGVHPTHRSWFAVRLEVTHTKATVFLKGKKLISFVPRFPVRGRAGVLVFRGAKNIIHFRNFRIKERV